MNNIYCDVMNNASPTSMESRFREGVKMGLVDGDVVDVILETKVHNKNYKRLLTWMSVM